MWRIRERSFVVQHQLHPAEAQVSDTSARLAGDIDGLNSAP